jgi:hypothetical protein
MRNRIVLVVAVLAVAAGLVFTKPGRSLLAYTGIVSADVCLVCIWN